MNLFKKATASIALVALVSSVFSTGVSANSSSQIEAANALAAKGFINTQADAADYNLNQNVLRQEIAKVAANMAGIEANTTCNGSFADVSATTPNTWACGYVEALLDAGAISANTNFRPEDNISKSEAVKMVLEAAGYEGIYTNASNWQEEVVAFAVDKGIVASFTNYNTPATRGFIFEAGNDAIVSMETVAEETCDEISQLLGLCGDETTMEDTTTDTTDTTVVVSSNNVLTVELSPETADAATIPGAISGLAVASFDFTAGSEDTTVTSLIVKRKGLSNADTLTGLAAFTSEGRISKAKNDSQENNTEATLTLDNGGIVIKAGETITLTIVADVATSGTTNGDEFAIELLEVTASTDVEGLENLVGNTMRVGGVDAATLTIETDGSVSDVKVGDEAVEIFKFKVEGSNDEDIILKSITFKGEGSVDEEDELSNYELEFDGSIVATSEANGKYVTFNLGDGVTIAEGQTERFKVLADIVAGVNEVIAFKVDKTLDVTAIGTKYGFGASVNIDAVDAADGISGGTNDLGDLTIDAGELTLSDIDAPADKIRADKDEVVLGSVKVSNVSGAALELQTFAVDVALTGGFIDDGIGGGTANDGNQNGTELAVTLDTVFENFEVEINGTAYELTAVNGTLASSSYSDTDLTVTLPEGVTTMVIRADTKRYVSAGTVAALTVNNIGTTGFKAVELQEETAVSDISPSSLSFKDIEFITAGAKLSAVPLADVTVVRGSNDIVANQFEIKAEEASLVEVDEVKVTVAGYVGGTVLANEANKVVSSVTLYKGSVSDANKLDQQSGTKISSAGLVTFDGFKTKIAANDTETFLAVISIVDGVDSVGKTLTVDVTSVNVTDDDGDDTSVTGTALNNKNIVVTNSGSFTVDFDANNDANEDTKTILAGTSVVVASYDVQAQNEAVDVETVDVTFDNTTNLSDAFLSAELILDGTVVGTATNSDLVGDTVTFDDLTMLEIPTENVELEVKVTTSTIGFEKVGSAIASNFITSISMSDVTGVDSGKTVVAQTELDDAKVFSVVDVVVVASVVKTLANGTAQLELTADSGDNTQAGSNSAPVVNLVSLEFTDNGNG